MKKIIALMVFLAIIVATASMAAVRGDEAMYVGGSLTTIPEKTEGRLDLSSEQEAKFTWKGGQVSIRFDKITSLEYGQKAGRRVGVAVVVSPLALFSKKRKHYLTIAFADETGKQQGAVFELSKGVVRSTLTTFESRSGKTVEYESEDAKKHIGN